MLERHIELHWFAIALNTKANNVARVGVSGEQICEFDLAVEWIDIVAVLFDLGVCDRRYDVADLQPSFHCRRIWFYVCDVNAVALAFLSGELTQFGIPRWEKRKTGGRKPLVILTFSFLQKMRDDGRRDGVDQLSAGIVAEQQSGELVIFYEWDRVTVFSILHRNADAVGEELSNVDRIRHHLYRCHQTFCREQGAGWLELPRGKPIADDRVWRDFERRDSIKECFLRWFEQREVGFIIDHLDFGRGFFPGLRALEFDVILV